MKFILLCLLLILSIQIEAQQTIYAEAGSETGRGILKSRGNECFAIIPSHLLRDHLGTLDIFGEGSLRAEADMVKTYNADLAILRFTGVNEIPCTSWKVDKDYQKIVDVVTKCKLEIREKTGGISTIATSVSGIDDEYLYIQPDNFREKIAKGMSGSSVFCEYQGRKVYLGMLQNVDGNVGEILMADEMEDILDEFFNPRKTIRSRSAGTDISLGIVRESGGYRFELTDIERSGSNMSLKFNVISQEKDNNLRLNYHNVTVFDENGLECKASNFILGSKSRYELNYNMIHGVTVPLEIQFNNIASSTKMISLLKFNFTESRNKGFFEIRDLEIPGGTEYGSQFDGNEIEGSKIISGFKFDLLGVSKTGQEVSIKFNVTSEERDREFRLQYSTIYLYDDKGFESKAKTITCGSQSGYDIRYNMIHGIATPLEIKFATVNSAAKNIALLKLAFKSGGVSAEYQQRNIPLDSPETYTSKGSNTSNAGCSEIYFYRMKNIAQCDEEISLLNHGEQILRLQSGTRYMALVCEDREFDFKATIGSEELIPGLKKPDFELGENYYFKIGCTFGATVIIQQDEQKGQEELNKRGKFKRQVESFDLNEW